MTVAERTQVQALLAGPYPYVDHELFQLDEAEARQRIFDQPDPVDMPDTGWYLRLLNGAPATNERAQTFVLTAKQERTLFQQYNYYRFRAARLVDQLNAARDGLSDVRRARELLEWDRQAQAQRNRIVEANLPLVLAMAKRVSLDEADYPDALGEANLDLMRSVELFDISRGYKFSTYACRAILNALRRVQRKGRQYHAVFPVDFDPALERSDEMERRRHEREQWMVDELHTIVRRNDAGLTDVERQVLGYRFAIPQEDAVEHSPRALTLAEVSRIKGFSKERARQIQKKALDKIRSLYADEPDEQPAEAAE